MKGRLQILEAALDVGLGRRYGHTGTESTDCVQFAEAVLQVAFPWLAWHGKHADLMVADIGRPFSNVDALIGMGFRETTAPAMGVFSYCQGWRRLPPQNPAGHCFLWWQPPAPDSGRSMLLEATNATADWYRPAEWADRQNTYSAGLRLVSLQMPDR